MTPAQKAAAQAILDHIAPGMEHTSVNQNLDTYADMAKAIVDRVTPEIFDAVAEMVAHKFPEEFSNEFIVGQLRQSARYRRAQLAAGDAHLHAALFGQNDTEESR